MESKGKFFTKTKIIVFSVVFVVLIGTLSLLAFMSYTDKIYDGVFIGDVDVSMMTKDEALNIVKKSYDDLPDVIKLKADGKTFEVSKDRISLEKDLEKTIDEAILYGKDKNIFKRIINMISLKFNEKHLNYLLKCDTDILAYEIDENLSPIVYSAKEYSVEPLNSSVLVTNGKNGRGVNINDAIDAISKSYTQNTLSDYVELKIVDISFKPIEFESFYNEYQREVKDAKVTEKDGAINIESEVIGISFDKEECKRQIEENKDKPSFYISAKITKPTLTTKDLEKEYTDTLLSTYTTSYSTSSWGRKENIRLASEKINGLVLNPGEIFSYNDVVGPRTTSTGFKVAHVYSGNKVVDGIGGGICQVSSTLYIAVLKADLEIVERTNHSLTVSYVPVGMDATVSYGTIDFKIRNNKAEPVKIEVIADSSNLTVNIYGRKKYVKDITIENVITGTNFYKTTYVDDDTMFEGETKVEQKGSNAPRVETYKVIKENGKVISKSFIAKSSYVATNEIIKVGTKKKIEETISPADIPSINDDENKGDSSDINKDNEPNEPNTQDTTLDNDKIVDKEVSSDLLN